MREGGNAHLEHNARNPAEGFIQILNFFRDGSGVTDQIRSGWPALGIVLRARCGWPATLFSDFGEGVRVPGKEIVVGLLGGFAEEVG